MVRIIGLLLFGAWAVFWSLLARRTFKKPPSSEDQSSEAVKTRMIRVASPLVLVVGLALMIYAVVSLANR
jgi:hypothetical protein